MPENLHLVTELAIILIAAGVFTILSKAAKQPAILGYVVAGFLVGPHLGLFPQFSTESINEWSEIGIIFLMFGLGLDFSFKKLLKIGSNALITAGITCTGMFIVGITLSNLLGWSTMEGIFLGGLMGMSSTTIIIKAYGDMNLMGKPYAPQIFGALVFEDLFAILLMVLLSAMAVTGQFEGKDMIMGILKLVFFLILWFLVGIYLIPLILKKAKRFLNDEILMIVGIGLCFGMVVLANLAGFSSALGAFVMGSLLSETVEGKQIESLTSKIKDLFGAIFFVSVGMMVDPSIIAQYWVVIIVIALSAVVGIFLFSTFGTLLSGQGVNNSIHTGFTMAQLGEFSFILAGLGCSLGVMREFIYPVIISASVITIIATPFLIRLGDPVAAWVDRKLPAKVLAIFNSKSDNRQNSKAEQNEWRKLLKKYFIRIALYSVITIAVILACRTYLPSLLDGLASFSMSERLIKWINLLITLVLISPFIYGMVVSGRPVRSSADILLSRNSANRWPLLALIAFRAILASLFVFAVILSHFKLAWWAILILFILEVLLFVYIAKKSASKISRLETTFLENLNLKEELERKAAPVSSAINEKLADYDITIRNFTISPEFRYIGKPLREMPFRRNAGINIIKILRGTRSIIIPGGDENIYPGDVILAVGAKSQLDKFAEMIQELSDVQPSENEEFIVESVVVGKDSLLLGRTLRQLDMRKNSCMIVNMLDKEGHHITNPSPEQIISLGDTVWIAGEKSSVEWYTACS